jgi:hypothetical protein
MEEVAGGWRILHNEELDKFYASPNIIRVIKSKRICTGHVTRMGQIINAYNVLFGNPEMLKRAAILLYFPRCYHGVVLKLGQFYHLTLFHNM